VATPNLNTVMDFLLPVRDTSFPKRTKPVIYGLEGGPVEVM